MLGRLIWNPIGALIVGLLALALGVAVFAGVNVACYGSSTSAMVQGSTCTDRKGNTLTYEAWKSDQKQISIYALVLGGVLVTGGSIGMAVRRKRRAAVSARY